MPYPAPYMPQPTGQYQPYQPPNYMTAGQSYNLVQQQQQQSIHGFVYVTGLEGARAYQMPPNSEMPLFDSTCDGVMFVKTTDAAGFPTIKVRRCYDEETQPARTEQTYATRDELDKVYRDLSEQLEHMKGAIYGSVSQAAADAKPGVGRNPNAAG